MICMWGFGSCCCYGCKCYAAVTGDEQELGQDSDFRARMTRIDRGLIGQR